jgi:hypothetical protein
MGLLCVLRYGAKGRDSVPMTPEQFACYTVAEFLKQYNFPIKQAIRREALKRGADAIPICNALDSLRQELAERAGEQTYKRPAKDSDHE